MMAEDDQAKDEASFVRHCAEKAWDDVQLAQIGAIQKAMVDFAATSWRHAGAIQPPTDVLLLCACEEGVVLMVQTQLGDWRTSGGVPHKPPRAWMPCPPPPPQNGKGR